MLPGMVKRLAPISLRIRNAEANAHARKVLRHIDEDLRVQRRVKWLATKARVVLSEMSSAAAPKLRSMPSADRDRWQSDVQRVTSILAGISERGVV